MKQTKPEVNYRQGTPPRQCANCTMWRTVPGGRNGSCTAVSGVIAPSAVCDLFKLRARVTSTGKEK